MGGKDGGRRGGEGDEMGGGFEVRWMAALTTATGYGLDTIGDRF